MYLFFEEGTEQTLEVIVSMADNEGATYKWSKYNSDEQEYETIDNSSEDPSKYTIASVGTNEDYMFEVNDKYGNTEIIQFYINSDYFDNCLNAYTIDNYDNKSKERYLYPQSDQDITLPVYVDAQIKEGITYQWYYSEYSSGPDEGMQSSTPIEGATDSEYKLDHTDAEHFKTGIYRCDVTDRFRNSSSVTFGIDIDNNLCAYADGDHTGYVEYYCSYGEKKTLTVNVSAIILDGLTYKWYDKDYNEITGQTGNTFEIDSVTEREEYRCAITDRFGNEDRIRFILRIKNEWYAYPAGESVYSQYCTINAEPEKPYTLEVVAQKEDENADISHLTYAWRENGSPLDSSGPEYTIDKVDKDTYYSCHVSDQYDNYYDIEYHVIPDSGLELNPSSDPAGETTDNKCTVYVSKGSSVILSPNASVKTGDNKFSYEWYDDDWDDAGSDSTLTIKNVTSRTCYNCYVYDCYGNGEHATFNIYVQNNLNVYPEGFEGSDSAYIYAKPGTKVRLHTVVEADEKNGLICEWTNYTDWNEIKQNTDKIEVEAANAHYKCEVTDRYNNSRSVDFFIVLDNQFEAYPQNAGKDENGSYQDFATFEKKIGDKVNLEVIASVESGGLSYTWSEQKKYDTIWGEEEYAYEMLEDSTAAISVTVSGTTAYRCIVRDDYGNEKEVNFYIKVGSLEAHPEGSTTDRVAFSVAKGASKDLKVNVTASKDAVLTYQWTEGQLNSSSWWPLDGGNGSTTNVLTVSPDNSSRYLCVVKDNYGNQAVVFFYVNVNGMIPSTNVGDLKLTGDNEYDVIVPIECGVQKEIKTIIEKKDGVTYKWDKVRNGRYERLTESTGNTITVKGGDANLYICYVKDASGNSLTINYYMIIDNKLTVTPVGGDGKSDSIDISASKGDKISLSVNVSATNKEKFTYSWQDSQQKELGSYASCNITVIGDAVYTCTVEDVYGNKEKATFRIWTDSIPIDKAQITLAASTYTYDGKTKTPEVTVKYGGKTLTKDTDYKVAYVNNTNAGTATVTISGLGKYTGSVTKQFTITKAAQSIKASLSPAKILTGATSKVTMSGVKEAAKLTYSSSNTAVATVNASGVVTAKKVGTATITVTAAATANYNSASAQTTVSVLPGATTKFTAVAAANGKGIKLTWNKVAGATQYQIYRNNKLIKTAGNVATYTDTKANTNGSKYTFKIVAKASTGASTKSKSVVYYKVNRPAVKKLTNSASKKMTVKWAKNAKSTGYQIQYGLKKNFKGAKTTKVNKKTAVSKTITKLKKGNTYYVRIRTYKKVGKVTYYSAWSAAKKVKIKK